MGKECNMGEREREGEYVNQQNCRHLWDEETYLRMFCTETDLVCAV